jgi:hypothetical protein
MGKITVGVHCISKESTAIMENQFNRISTTGIILMASHTKFLKYDKNNGMYIIHLKTVKNVDLNMTLSQKNCVNV